MFAQRLRALRKEKNLTLDELAARYQAQYGGGLSKGTLSRYENGRQQPLSTVVSNLAQLLGCSADYLLREDYSQYPNIIPTPNLGKIPILGTIAAGSPILAEENIEEYVDFAQCKTDFALRVKGSSMINANIRDGDIVFIQQQPDVDDGQIAAVLIDEEATLKRVYHQQHAITLVAENPRFAPMTFSETDDRNIRILGKAVAVLSMM